MSSQKADSSRVARGGRRKSAGRKALVETRECLWIVEQIRAVAQSKKIISARLQQAIKKQNPKFVEAHRELDEEYEKLDNATPALRKNWIENYAGTPIEEIRELREQTGFLQLIHVPAPNQFMLNRIYQIVAARASRQFVKPIFPRNAKNCANAWVKFGKESRLV